MVRSVFVEPGLQGAGIGRQLMYSLEAVAASNEVKPLKVPSSITAEGFYRAMGYPRRALWRRTYNHHGQTALAYAAI